MSQPSPGSRSGHESEYYDAYDSMDDLGRRLLDGDIEAMVEANFDLVLGEEEGEEEEEEGEEEEEEGEEEEEEEEGDDDDEDEDEDEDDDDDDDDDDFEDEADEPFRLLSQHRLRMVFGGDPESTVLRMFGLTSTGETVLSESRRLSRRRDPNRFPKVPSAAGRALMDSGVFGVVGADTRRQSVPQKLLLRELGYGHTFVRQQRLERQLAQQMLPSETTADQTVRYDAPVYLGQFSDDGNFFYSATKDFRVRMYDTANVQRWKHYKTVVHPSGRWTLTDASLSPDNKWLAFTSMMPHVCLAPTDPYDEGEPYLLDLAAGAGPGPQGFFHGFAIFAVRFSGDGRELVVGTNDASILVYDIESRTVLHQLEGHEDDVNAVAFGDRGASPHLLYSGSDDATVKVWDRRSSLRDGRPAGVFVGHLEGVTYLDSNGDGRYLLSNGKDQTMRLWDLRMAMSSGAFDRDDPCRLTRHSAYDYRFQAYDDRTMFYRHPHDNAVVVFRGHRVERTLIRCHFAPPASADRRYVYSASHDGNVYVWNLDATLAATIHVRGAYHDVVQEAANIPDATDTNDDDDQLPHNRRRPRRHRRLGGDPRPICVRDASWHPTAPVLVASGFNTDSMESGICSMHSIDIANDGRLSPVESRLFDDKMRPITGWRAVDVPPVENPWW